MSRRLRTYLRLHPFVAHLPRPLRVVFGRIFFRLLSPSDLNRLTALSYAPESGFGDADHNTGRLWPWEEQVFASLFTGRRALLVAGAGGGREVVNLARAGHRVTGFDSSAWLVERARDHLSQLGLDARLIACEPDRVPAGIGPFDGLVIGRGVYHHIPRREARVAFLSACRVLLRPSAPMALGDVLAGDRSADALGVSYIHRFTKDELAEELTAAGFTGVEVLERSDFLGDREIHATATNAG